MVIKFVVLHWILLYNLAEHDTQICQNVKHFFIHELSWILTIPEEYEAQVQGNVAIDRSTATKSLRPNVIPLRKELVRGEHPAVEIHYQRRGLRD